MMAYVKSLNIQLMFAVIYTLAALRCHYLYTYFVTPQSLTHSLIHSHTWGKYFFKKNVGSLTGKNSGTSILCPELPLNPRNGVALYLTVQCQTLMQRTGHILRARGNPRDYKGTTYVTIHTDGSPMIKLACWPASKIMQPSLVHCPLVIMIFAPWGNVRQGITGVRISTRIPLHLDLKYNSNIRSKCWNRNGGSASVLITRHTDYDTVMVVKVLVRQYQVADKSLVWPGRKQAGKHVRGARDFNKIEMRAVIKCFFLQGKAPKEIHAILTETLACFFPGQAKNLSAPLY